MSFSLIRSSLTAASLLVLGSAAAFADCNVGDFQCSGGYRYVCKCWTATGCNYEPAGGSCHHDDIDTTAAMVTFQSLMKSNIHQTALLCRASDQTSLSRACLGR
jgi:hypothetical protein